MARGEVLSQAEYDRRFGVSQAQVDAVATWLRARGLTVTSADRVAGAVGARGSVAALQRALHTTLATAVQQGHAGLVPVTAPCCRPRSVSARSWGSTPRPWPCRRACGAPPYRRAGPWSGTPAAARRTAGDTAVRPLLGGARQHRGQALRQRVQLPLRWLPAPAAGHDVRRDGCEASCTDGGHPRRLRRQGHEGGHQHVHGPVPLPAPGQLHLLPGGEPAFPEPVRRHGGVGG